MKFIVSLLLMAIATTLFGGSDLIPHGQIARTTGSGVIEAYYACPTTRYAHGVLGDAIEGGCLKVKDHNGKTHRLTLPVDAVFEDITPRIADLNNDGNNDVVTVQSSASEGAALTVYSLIDNQLSVLGTSPPIGRPNRWLAPAGIADFNDDGMLDVAYVQTPHIGGTLKIWSFIDGTFTQIAALAGFSNHSIGSSRVSYSKVVDHNHDGIADLALPDQSQTEILFVTMMPELAVIDRQARSNEFFQQK